jgi:hypothetical protein
MIYAWSILIAMFLWALWLTLFRSKRRYRFPNKLAIIPGCVQLFRLNGIELTDAERKAIIAEFYGFAWNKRQRINRQEALCREILRLRLAEKT